MKAKWVNIVDSLQGNEEDIKDRYIEISKYRDIERRTDISRYRDIDISNREPTYRNIEKSIYRRGKKENKANNK